jgi:hypothetical protein
MVLRAVAEDALTFRVRLPLIYILVSFVVKAVVKAIDM